MPNLPDVVLWSIPAFILLLAVELVSYRIHPDEDEVGYKAKDTGASLAMGLGSLDWDLLWGIPIKLTEALRVAYHEYADLARDFVAAASWRECFARVFAAPGWKP